MKHRIMLAVLTAAIPVAMAAPARALVTPSVLAGLAEITPPDCARGALKFPVAAASDGGPVLLSVRSVSVALDCPAVVWGAPMAFAGTWRPTTGGCLASITHPGVTLCLGAVPSKLTLTTTSASLCFAGQPCWPGTATVTRT